MKELNDLIAAADEFRDAEAALIIALATANGEGKELRDAYERVRTSSIRFGKMLESAKASIKEEA